jgi:hypothetical protein
VAETTVNQTLYGDPQEGEHGIISQQLFDARIKAHEIVEEHLKQVITIAAGTLGLTVSFLKDIVGPSGSKAVYAWLLPACWILLAISITVAVICIAMLINNLDAPDLERSTIIPGKPWIKAFGVGSKQYLINTEWAALMAFIAGMMALALFASLNYKLFLNRKGGEAGAGEQAAKTFNHFVIVTDPDHWGTDNKKHSHTFLLDQATGTVWDLNCRADKSVNFRQVPVDKVPEVSMSAQPKPQP